MNFSIKEEEINGSSTSSHSSSEKKFKGVRRRKWGKWVSEIRVPATRDRLWLGTYSTPEAAAFARDVAFYCLHRPSSLDNLNFPLMMLPANLSSNMSPKTIQKVASDAGMAVDAHMIIINNHVKIGGEEDYVQGNTTSFWDGDDRRPGNEGEALSISVDDYLQEDLF